MSNLKLPRIVKYFFLADILLAILVVGVYLGLNYLNNTRMGLRSSLSSITNLIQASQNRLAGAQDEPIDIFFLHHSVGMNLIQQGGVRQLFSEAGYRFWDQGYNSDEGLRNPQGERLDYVYYVPHDNTDPDGLEIIFTQPTFDLPVNTFSGLLQHDVIIFKSCFPNSQINSEAELEELKGHYLQMRSVFERHPEKLFIAVTQPPLNPAVTNSEAAARARALTVWLRSEDFLQGSKNLVTFDLFDRLAERDPGSSEFNMLREDYRQGTDSHPTAIANETSSVWGQRTYKAFNGLWLKTQPW